MKTVAITQRVSVVPEYGERRDCLDQAWTRFLSACGSASAAAAERRRSGTCVVRWGRHRRSGVDRRQRSGGRGRRCAGARRRRERAARLRRAARPAGAGRMPRHAADSAALRDPVVAASRATSRHARSSRINGEPTEVNSYHRFAAFESRPPLEVWAVPRTASSRRSGMPRAASPASCGIRSDLSVRRADIALFQRRVRARLMRALILAAGRGSRMGASGRRAAQSAWCELDRRAIDRASDRGAARGGVGDDRRRPRLSRRACSSVPALSLLHNQRWAETNMVHVAAPAPPSGCARGPVIVSYADIFYRGESGTRSGGRARLSWSSRYDRPWRELCGRGASPIRCRMPRHFGSMLAGKLLEIGGRAQPDRGYPGTVHGLAEVHAARLERGRGAARRARARRRDRLDMTGLLRRLLAAKRRQHRTFGTDGQWGEIDNPGRRRALRSNAGRGELTLEPVAPAATGAG